MINNIPAAKTTLGARISNLNLSSPIIHDSKNKSYEPLFNDKKEIFNIFEDFSNDFQIIKSNIKSFLEKLPNFNMIDSLLSDM